MNKVNDKRITQITYFIGAIVVLTGIITFMADNWNVWSNIVRSLVLIIPAAIIYIASFSLQKEKLEAIKNISLLCSYALFGGGIYYLINSLGMESFTISAKFILVSLYILFLSLITYLNTKTPASYFSAWMAFLILILSTFKCFELHSALFLFLIGVFVILFTEATMRVFKLKSLEIIQNVGLCAYLIGLLNSIMNFHYLMFLFFIPILIFGILKKMCLF